MAATQSPDGIDLVVTDLDGTLWDGTGTVHPASLHALGVLRAASIPVLAATGRRLASAWPLMEANGIALPAVLLDGALGQEFGATTAFYRRVFSRATATQVLEILGELGISPCVNVDEPGRDVVLGGNPSSHPAHIRFLEPFVRDEDPWTAVQTMGVLAFTLVGGEPSLMQELAAEVTARAPVAAAASSDRTYGGLHLSFRPLGVNKWSGVEAFCALRGHDPSRVLAVGDADNDVELLEAAAVAVAVADGTEAAVSRAHRVVPPASEGGWAEILEMLA